MTEAEWLECADLRTMLEFLRGKPSDRKLRLSACALAVGLLGELGDELSRRKIEAVERLAANGDLKEFASVMADVRSPRRGTFYNRYRPDDPPFVRPGSIMVPGMLIGLVESMGGLYHLDAEWIGVVVEVVTDSTTTVEELDCLFGFILLDEMEEPHHRHDSMTQLLRCIFGNPFRPQTPLPPAVLAWNDGTVRRLAEGIYEERQLPAGTLDAARLAILADALLDAGCDDEELIAHCRNEGPHVRGCWTIDLILGKG
jgi:biotin carboxyl carrier protein